jgi:hypothetical protein
VLPLTREAKPGPARDERHNIWAGPEQFSQEGGCLDHLLEVVQHQQEMLIAQIPSEPRRQRLVTGLPYA